jgi:hypothetical protein
MAKRKVGSQIVNLTPNHLKLEISLISLCAGDVPHIARKLLTRATTLLQTSSQSKVYTQNYRLPKLWESQFQELGVLKQNDIWVLASWPSTESTIRGKVMASPKSKL